MNRQLLTALSVLIVASACTRDLSNYEPFGDYVGHEIQLPVDALLDCPRGSTCRLFEAGSPRASDDAIYLPAGHSLLIDRSYYYGFNLRILFTFGRTVRPPGQDLVRFEYQWRCSPEDHDECSDDNRNRHSGETPIRRAPWEPENTPKVRWVRNGGKGLVR